MTEGAGGESSVELGARKREEVVSRPQAGGWAEQEEESLAFRHEGRG